MSKLNDILAIVSANSEESIDDFLTLLSPEVSSKEEIRQTFEDTIGYDPVSYFDKKEIKEKINNLLEEDIPDEVSDYLTSDTEEVVNDVYEVFDENKSQYLDEALNTTVYENTGWSPSEEDDDNELD